MPLEIHIDTLKTGVASGAGAVITPPFQTFTRTCGFSVNPSCGTGRRSMPSCVPSISSGRVAYAAPPPHDNNDNHRGAGRRAAIAGSAVPAHESFDCVVARRVTGDCLVSFEGRRYSCRTHRSVGPSKCAGPHSSSSFSPTDAIRQSTRGTAPNGWSCCRRTMRRSRRRQVRATDVVGLSRAATRWDLGLVSGRKVARPGSRAAHSVRTATASA